jgi:hypothetical protein
MIKIIVKCKKGIFKTKVTNQITINELCKIACENFKIDNEVVLNCKGVVYSSYDTDKLIELCKTNEVLYFTIDLPKTPEPSPVKRKLCTANCGFFGDPTTNGLCSMCFKSVESESLSIVVVLNVLSDLNKKIYASAGNVEEKLDF